ncbi:MAG: phage holin family protein [Syntrophales bacterium]|nr:phage holin family protein [Syntrophales bacterium]
MGIFIRWLILTIAIVISSYFIEGVRVQGFLSAFSAAAVLGVMNVFLRPILLLVTLPINVLTLGVFTFLINALLLKMTAAVIPGFDVEGFWSAVLGAMVVSLVSWLLNFTIGDSGRVEIITWKRRQ